MTDSPPSVFVWNGRIDELRVSAMDVTGEPSEARKRSPSTRPRSSTKRKASRGWVSRSR